MDKDTQGKLLAWEVIARESLKHLSAEQRAAVLASVSAQLNRQEPAVAGAATTVLRSLR